MYIVRPLLQTLNRLNYQSKIISPSYQINYPQPYIRRMSLKTNIIDNRVPEIEKKYLTKWGGDDIRGALDDPYCSINILLKNSRIILDCKKTIKLFAKNLFSYYLYKAKNDKIDFPKLEFNSNVNKNYKIETISCLIKNGKLNGKLVYDEDKEVDDIYVELAYSRCGLLEGPVNIRMDSKQLAGTFYENKFSGILFYNPGEKYVFINDNLFDGFNKN